MLNILFFFIKGEYKIVTTGLSGYQILKEIETKQGGTKTERADNFEAEKDLEFTPINDLFGTVRKRKIQMEFNLRPTKKTTNIETLETQIIESELIATPSKSLS